MSGTQPSSGCGGVGGSSGGGGGGTIGGIGSSIGSTGPITSSLLPNTGASGASVGAASSADHFCLRWNNYQTNMTTVFDQLLQEEVFVDVTLSCEGGAQLRAHKVVLAACSPYFQSVLQHNPCKHPIIIMPRDVVFVDLRAIIEFVYRGEIDVAQEQINSLLQAAEILKIKGLCEVSDDPTNMPPGFTATPSTRPTQQVNGQATTPLTNNTSVHNSRGRPPLSRGRYSYRPRGRPPLYGRHRYDRPNLPSRTSQGLRDQQPSKRIKTEMCDEEMSNNTNMSGGLVSSAGAIASSGCGGGISSIATSTQVMPANDMQRSHSTHYVSQDQPPQQPQHQQPPQQQQQHNGVPQQAAALAPSLPPPNHAPPAAHVHHGHSQAQGHAAPPLSTHPPAAHVPPPLPELGPSVALLTDENTSGVSHGTGTPDYEAYYVKTEDPQQQQHQQQQQQQHQQQQQQHQQQQQQQSHMTVGGQHMQPDPNDPTGQRMTVTPELLGLMPSGTPQYTSDNESLSGTPTGRKLWTDEDMDKALDSLRNSQMSLSRAAQVFGIPATTLWQRAHRMGIETPKKEGANKTWSEHDLAGALEELRSGRLSANRASKEFGIPNSTLYKIARKEGIKLSSPFSAIQPSWNPEDLNRALDAIRGGMSVQKSAQEFGIPTGTLYGRCRREGIELSKYQGVPWSEEDMKDALEVVRVGEMSINQAAIHYNLPYSSLYGRFKRGKYEDGLSHQDFLHQEMTIEHYSGDQLSVQQSSLQQSLQSVSLPQQTTSPPHQNTGQALSTSGPPDQY